MLARPFVALFGVERASKYDMVFGTPSALPFLYLLQEKGGKDVGCGPTRYPFVYIATELPHRLWDA
jgi:hypothetical protein